MFFLARKADGADALRRFANSYRAYSPGLSHDLVVMFKGFEQQRDLQEARGVFHGIEYQGLEMPDVGFDIGAYFEGAKRVANRYLVFCNTHSEIAANDWLAALSRHAFEERVGISGAMGSYESLHDTVKILRGVIWKSIGAGSNYDRNVAYYFDFLLRTRHSRWYSSTGDVIAPRHDSPRYLKKLAISVARLVSHPWVALRGTALIWPGAPRFNVQPFPRFPNPHVRSNGFMIRRDRWLQSDFSPTRKVDTSLFESGPNSMTARLRAGGLATIVVGRDGKDYDVAHWPRSRTFRLGDQANLLVHDNHTRAFETMSAGARVAHAWMTWGNYLDTLPADFPDLGFTLARVSSY